MQFVVFCFVLLYPAFFGGVFFSMITVIARCTNTGLSKKTKGGYCICRQSQLKQFTMYENPLEGGRNSLRSFFFRLRSFTFFYISRLSNLGTTV